MRPLAAPIAVSCGIVLVILFSPAQATAKTPANPPIVLQYREIPIFMGPHEHWVTAIAFSPDGKTLATGADDGYLRLWDAGTARLKSMHSDDASRGVNGLAYSPDGRQIAAVGGLFGKEALVWDTASGRIAQNSRTRPVWLTRRRPP